mmetsp:Transcript_26195/g.56626  ORF Transcript_26195/g.56626 Transcript_26195/m.56626 type:complete len:237 (-) Transcript_26195:249-959(-)
MPMLMAMRSLVVHLPRERLHDERRLCGDVENGAEACDDREADQPLAALDDRRLGHETIHANVLVVERATLRGTGRSDGQVDLAALKHHPRGRIAYDFAGNAHQLSSRVVLHQCLLKWGIFAKGVFARYVELILVHSRCGGWAGVAGVKAQLLGVHDDVLHHLAAQAVDMVLPPRRHGFNRSTRGFLALPQCDLASPRDGTPPREEARQQESAHAAVLQRGSVALLVAGVLDVEENI